MDNSLTNDRVEMLSDNNVRIVTLPPMTVAAIHIMGSMAELEAEVPIRKFIQKHKLTEMKPDLRHFGFNHPDGKPDGRDHGYERWITIPDTLEVEAPFVKKHFSGGLYGAHRILMGAFDEWMKLFQWSKNNAHYEFASGDPECMHGCLEEHLDTVNKYLLPANDQSIEIDLLIPIKKKR